MSSWTLGTYTQGSTYVEYRWDKYWGWELIVGTKLKDGLVHTTYHNTYCSQQGAKRAFQRVVRKLKKGEY